MPKYKVVVSLGVHSTIVEAKDKDEAIEKAGEEIISILEAVGIESFVEIYEATLEEIEENNKEKAEMQKR